MNKNLLILAILLFFSSGLFAQKGIDEPVKVYVLVGQSNMQGKAAVEGDREGSLNWLIKNDPKNEFQFVVDKDGKWIERKDVWINLLGTKYSGLKPGYGSSNGQIGPELGFGHKIGDVHTGQVLLIKAAWGGKSLGNDFLPPSIGKYKKPEKPGAPGFYYHEVLRIVKDVTENIRTYFPDYKDQGIEIAGLCYHQGWNDQYGGIDVNYETNLAAFINDIRSAEHGLGIPSLPIVIATSGMIEKETPIKKGQLAMADTKKYPQFAGNVSVVDTDKPYGPNKMKFKFYTKRSPKSIGYHWNDHAASYTNIGRAMAAEMQKLEKPKLPSRLVAVGRSQGVELTWQYGSENSQNVKLIRNGKEIQTKLNASQTRFVDTTALPGKNEYKLIFEMSKSDSITLRASSDTSVTNLKSYRSTGGVMLNWQAQGKYDSFEISRDGKVIAKNVSPDLRNFEDKTAPEKGMVKYTVQPNTGNVTPAYISVNRGPVNAGSALVYEPFDYSSDNDKFPSLIGKNNAVGTKGKYFIVGNSKPDRMPATVAGGLSYGNLPVTGNRVATHRWSAGCAIELDDSLKNAGLLKDGAELWISWVFCVSEPHSHRKGGGMFTLSTKDFKEGVGFKAHSRQFETVVVLDGKPKTVRITSSRKNVPTLVVGKIVWGKNGENDSFVPYTPGFDLKQPEKHGRKSVPFNIDQTKLSHLNLTSEGSFDEIRIGPTYDSVVGK